MFDVLDDAGNAVTLFFEDLEGLVQLAGEMIKRATGAYVPARAIHKVVGFCVPCAK